MSSIGKHEYTLKIIYSFQIGCKKLVNFEGLPKIEYFLVEAFLLSVREKSEASSSASSDSREGSCFLTPPLQAIESIK